MLFHLHAARLRANVNVGAPVRETKQNEKSDKKESVNCAARLTSIRNRLDQSRRKAEDGWLNRASGTGDEGGRGRTI